MSCLSTIIYLVALFYSIIIAWGQVSTNLLLSSFITLPDELFAALPVLQSILLILPILPLAIFIKNHVLKAIFKTWIATATIGIFLAPIQLLDQSSAQPRAVMSTVIASVCILLTIIIGWTIYPSEYRARLKSIYQPIGNIKKVLIFATLFYIAWLTWGALGSWVDTAIMLTNAIILGILITLIIDLFLFAPLGKSGSASAGMFLLASTGVGIALTIFASGLNFPFGGMQLILMLCLPCIGPIALFLYQRNWKDSKNPLLATIMVFGFTLSAPMLLFDPDELSLVLNSTKGEIGTWALYASLASGGIACIVSLCLFIGKVIISRPASKTIFNHLTPDWGKILTFIILGIGLLLHFFVGQPGWHGEQLFVILKDQAVIAQDPTIDDSQEKRELVYYSLVQHANTTQSNLRTLFDRFNIHYQPFYLVNSIQVDGGPFLRMWLMTRPEVDRVLESPHLRPLPEELKPPSGDDTVPSEPDWNISQIQSDKVWQEFDINGSGIIIGQSDSGVQWDHPELLDSYRGRNGDHNYNWLDPWNNTTEPIDLNGHGTHTLGTILGNRTGIAPGATWYACANLVRNLGNPAFYLECMQFMLAPYPLSGDPFTDGDPALGANIMNNSWGCPGLEGCDEDTFLYAVRNLRAAGIFVVASAGNDGPGCGTLKFPPANYAELFTVGAIDSMGELATFSSIGPSIADNIQVNKPDLIAPGVDIISSTPGNTYARYSGTSMAGPHVVGVVALMWSANPNLIGDIPTTTKILLESADPYQGALPNCPGANNLPSTAVGYGIVNAYRAVELALQMK